MTWTRERMAEYQRKRRAASQSTRAYDTAYQRARNRALTQLSREYPERYEQLLAAYRSRGADGPEQTAARRAVLATGGK